MFIIVPKQSNRASNEPRSEPPATDDRGPVRAGTACDACRAKKTKCNGQNPCSRCQSKRMICVYSRPTTNDAPVSAAHVALLQHQQQRMYTALQRMAAVISKYENAPGRSPESFDVLELLAQYAPPNKLDGTQQNYQLDDVRSQSIKRRRDDTLIPSSVPTVTAADQTFGNETFSSQTTLPPNQSAVPFEIQPSGNFPATQENMNQAYQAMVQFLRSMASESSNQPNPSPPPIAPAATDMLGDTTWQPSISNSTVPSAASANNNGQWGPADSTQQFMDLVDWNSSLQNLYAFDWNAPNEDENAAYYTDPNLINEGTLF